MKMRFSSLLLIVVSQLLPVAASALAGAADEQSSRHMRTQDRTDAFDTDELLCQIGLGHDEDGSKVQRIEFEYWYAIGSGSNVTETELNILETILFYQSMQTGMVWCTSETASGIPVGRERHLAVSAEEETARKLFTQRARELGIIAVNSGPKDNITEYECPTNPTDFNPVDDLMNSTGATNCVVVTGQMSILAHKADDVSFLIASLRDSIEDLMIAANTTNSFPDIPNISFLAYLGDDEDEALGTVEEISDDSGIGIILGVAIPLVVGLVAAALLMKRNRDTMTATEYQDMMTSSDFVLVGTGDPVGSFHEGLYHYMRDGTRYLSTRCEGCLETRKNSFYTDYDLGTIMEGQEYQDSILGAKNPTVDVHKCTSAVCDRCSPVVSNKTFFVAPSSPTGSRGAHSLFTDIHLTAASPNDSSRASEEQSEV